MDSSWSVVHRSPHRRLAVSETSQTFPGSVWEPDSAWKINVVLNETIPPTVLFYRSLFFSNLVRIHSFLHASLQTWIVLWSNGCITGCLSLLGKCGGTRERLWAFKTSISIQKIASPMNRTPPLPSPPPHPCAPSLSTLHSHVRHYTEWWKEKRNAKW